ncbi:MAG: PilZ domain-containing protein [Gammaproteobacteria bacterium]
MERRYQARRVLDLDVVLYDGQGRMGSFKARNLSLGGIYIETGPIDLCIGDLLDVSCVVDCHTVKKQKLRGIVVHHTDQGVGVMFRDYDVSSLETMGALDGDIAVAAMAGERDRGL